MLRRILNRLSGGGSTAPVNEIVARDHHQGFELRAIPIREGDVWRVAGSIVKVIAGEERSYQFVRADTYPGRDDAAAVSLRKAQQIVDEQGERVFDQLK